MTSDSPSPKAARGAGKGAYASASADASNSPDASASADAARKASKQAPKPAKAPRKGKAPNASAVPAVSDGVTVVADAAPALAVGTRVRDRSPIDPGDPTAATSSAARDIADVSAVELVSTVSVHLLSAAALRCGLADEGEDLQDLSEARVIINALAGLITAAAPDLGDTHARALRDGLRSVQLAFREASMVPDAPGEGPGEKYTGPVR